MRWADGRVWGRSRRAAEVLRSLETIVGEVESESRGEKVVGEMEETVAAAQATSASAAAATTAAGGSVEVATTAEGEEGRECMVCMSAPRQVRFM
jgi:hypothetical protein